MVEFSGSILLILLLLLLSMTIIVEKEGMRDDGEEDMGKAGDENTSMLSLPNPLPDPLI
jgi:hypothetical protein